MSRAPRILYLTNVDWFFLSHRMPLARAAVRAGAEVYSACTDTGRASQIRDAGITFVPLDLARSGRDPWRELGTVRRIARLFREVGPDLVHQSTTKAVVYGSLVAHLPPRPAVVNTIGGMGYVFASADREPILRTVLGLLYRFGLRNPRASAILQNEDDRRAFLAQRIVVPSRAVVIQGAGVDLARFRARPEPDGEPVVMLPARMLWDKGVGEFVEAARRLRASGSSARFALVGSADADNPAGVPEAQLRDWTGEKVVEWWGHRDDIEEALARSTIVVLPSYREGLPKVLQEAAATARALVTTDVPGCRDVVRSGENGLVVPARDPGALAQAIGRLLEDAPLRRRMAEASRHLAVERFTEERIVAETLALYRRILGPKGLELRA